LNTLILIIVLAAATVSVLVGIALRNRRSTVVEVPSAEGMELNSSIAEFIQAIQYSSSETEDPYVKALSQLRRYPDNAARQIEAAYRAVPGEKIPARKLLLLSAVALAHKSMLPLLIEVANEPVSGQTWHDGGRAAEESMLRMMAVDGIDAISLTGDTDAADALLSLASSSDRAVQASAVVALKYAPAHSAHYDKLRSVLPPDRLYLLDVVRANVRDIPQIRDPRKHLLSEPTTVDTRPDPVSGERRNVGMSPGQARVPKASMNKE
jgi:hypothetical protein